MIWQKLFVEALVAIRRRERKHGHFPPQNISFRIFAAHFSPLEDRRQDSSHIFLFLKNEQE
jgi:hypothetical protein